MHFYPSVMRPAQTYLTLLPDHPQPLSRFCRGPVHSVTMFALYMKPAAWVTTYVPCVIYLPTISLGLSFHSR